VGWRLERGAQVYPTVPAGHTGRRESNYELLNDTIPSVAAPDGEHYSKQRQKYTAVVRDCHGEELLDVGQSGAG
jgi:hypothetical protein